MLFKKYKIQISNLQKEINNYMIENDRLSLRIKELEKELSEDRVSSPYCLGCENAIITEDIWNYPKCTLNAKCKDFQKKGGMAYQ